MPDFSTFVLGRGNDHDTDTAVFKYQPTVRVAPGASRQKIVLDAGVYGKTVSITICFVYDGPGLNATFVSNTTQYKTTITRGGREVKVRNWYTTQPNVTSVSGTEYKVELRRGGFLAVGQSSGPFNNIATVETLWSGAIYDSSSALTYTTENGITTVGGKITYNIWAEIDVLITGVNNTKAVCDTTVADLPYTP